MNEQKISYYINMAKKMVKTKGRTLKIALLSNFTIKGLKEIIQVKCNEVSVNAEVYEANYNQISQEIIDKNSELRKNEPDITFLLINQKHILGNVEGSMKSKTMRASYIKKMTDEFIEIIDLFTQNISGLVVVSNLPNICYSPLGIIDEKTKLSIKDMALYFNKILKDEYLRNKKVFIYDMSAFFAKYGTYNIINEKLNYLGDMFISLEYLPYLAEELMAFIKPYCYKNKKCIVLDLDNTLWGGVVGEEGIENIQLDNKPPGNAFYEFQKKLLELHKRGIILAINSKNNPEDALKVIREHPYMVLREKCFAALKINWNAKVTNMKELAKEINIGTDSLVFFDDDPMNRDMIKKMMPEIKVVDLPEDPSLYARTLEQINDFNVLQITKEDIERGKMYYKQRKRSELKKQYENVDNYLKSLKMEVEFVNANNFNIPRIAQLTQKTNQFNLTTRRYTEEEIQNLANSSEFIIHGIIVKDKFGDNGLTGVFMINKKSRDKWIIDNFLLSCRILGRQIENIMLNQIRKLAEKAKIKELIGEYIPTSKNMQTASFYRDNGFISVDKNEFILENPRASEDLHYIKIS